MPRKKDVATTAAAAPPTNVVMASMHEQLPPEQKQQKRTSSSTLHTSSTITQSESSEDLKRQAQTQTSQTSSNSRGGGRGRQVPRKSLHVAVQGCCHGELDKIYQRCREHESSPGGKPIDLLICCGDFQSIRRVRKNSHEPSMSSVGGGSAEEEKEDLDSLAIPPKFKFGGNIPRISDFYAYHEGLKIAPILTIFIGGNHEASNQLFAEYYGGFVAPNIYYLGHSGVIQVGGLRIAGLSGIYKHYSYRNPYPLPPYYVLPTTSSSFPPPLHHQHQHQHQHPSEHQPPFDHHGYGTQPAQQHQHQHQQQPYAYGAGNQHQARSNNNGRPPPMVVDQNAIKSAYHCRQFEHDKMAMFCEALAFMMKYSNRDNTATTTANSGASADAAAVCGTGHDVGGEGGKSEEGQGQHHHDGGGGGWIGIDLMLSHDWPVGVTRYGDERKLLQIKPYFRDDIAANRLGNPTTLRLLQTLMRPRFWFSAHLHVKFQAEVPWSDASSVQQQPVPLALSEAFAAVTEKAESEGKQIQQRDDLDNTTTIPSDPVTVGAPGSAVVADVAAKDSTPGIFKESTEDKKRVVATEDNIGAMGANKRTREEEEKERTSQKSVDGGDDDDDDANDALDFLFNDDSDEDRTNAASGIAADADDNKKELTTETAGAVSVVAAVPSPSVTSTVGNPSPSMSTSSSNPSSSKKKLSGGLKAMLALNKASSAEHQQNQQKLKAEEEEESAKRINSTHFLALDKCVREDSFIEFFDMPLLSSHQHSSSSSSSSSTSFADAFLVPECFEDEKITIRPDPLWMEVIKASHQYIPVTSGDNHVHRNYTDMQRESMRSSFFAALASSASTSLTPSPVASAQQPPSTVTAAVASTSAPLPPVADIATTRDLLRSLGMSGMPSKDLISRCPPCTTITTSIAADAAAVPTVGVGARVMSEDDRVKTTESVQAAATAAPAATEQEDDDLWFEDAP